MKYSGQKEIEPERKVSGEEKMVSIMFTENRKFELFIGKKLYVFNGSESKPFPAKDLNHPDFIQQQKYFSVKGV